MSEPADPAIALVTLFGSRTTYGAESAGSFAADLLENESSATAKTVLGLVATAGHLFLGAPIPLWINPAELLLHMGRARRGDQGEN